MKRKIDFKLKYAIAKQLLLCFTVFLFSVSLSAQTLPYFHGFEDAVENAQWKPVLNASR